MNILLTDEDIPSSLLLEKEIAIDTETTGVNLIRDRLCLVQLKARSGPTYLIQIKDKQYPNLIQLLINPNILKIFHYARFDIAMLYKHFTSMAQSVYCTKIASRLARTYSDRHGLKTVCKELLQVDISKEQQSSDWAASELSTKQKEYAATDVIHLHALMDSLDKMLIREGRQALASECFSFLKTRVVLDLQYSENDIFHYM